jgi:hypothetical protein
MLRADSSFGVLGDVFDFFVVGPIRDSEDPLVWNTILLEVSSSQTAATEDSVTASKDPGQKDLLGTALPAGCRVAVDVAVAE